jgi:hypothetical protein
MTWRGSGVLFVIVAGLMGLIHWWQADWWYYVDFPDGPMPKFKAPVWEQVVVSGLVGCFCGAVVVGVVTFARTVVSRLHRRS